MNKVVIGLLGCLAGITAALAAVPLKATPGNGWTATGEGEWTIDYAGHGYPALSFNAQVRPGAFYRISWRKESLSGAETPSPVLMLDTGRPQRVDCTGDRGMYVYYSGDESELKFRFYFNPGKTGKIRLTDVKVIEVPTTALTDNLLPNGDWENGALIDFWQPGWNVRAWYASLVPSPEFLSGERSLLLVPAPDGQRYAIISGYMPAVPGSEVELRFWAKADRETALVANIDCQSPSKQVGKHLYLLRTFKLDTEWREYVLRFKLPTDRTAYPALDDRVARIHFGRETGIAGNIWIDNVEFRQVKPPEQ